MDIFNLLDRPIAYHRVFAKLTGSANGGVFLSQAFFWSSRTTLKDNWFYKTIEEWADETFLSRREIDTVRGRLKKMGILEEDLRGIPARLHYRINREVLEKALETLEYPAHTSVDESAGPVSAKEPSQFGGKRQSNTENTTQNTSKTTKEKEKENTKEKETAPFDEFWAVYPKRPGDSKKKAEEKYRTAIRGGATHKQIMAGAIAYTRTRKGADPVYTAMASTWLHQNRWEADYGPEVDPKQIDEFCITYPSKNIGSRALIEHHYTAAIQSATHAAIMEGLEKYCILVKQKKGEGYPLQLPAAAVWLQHQRWREMDNYDIAFRGMGEKYLRAKRGEPNV